jgi:hypothetical protein
VNDVVLADVANGQRGVCTDGTGRGAGVRARLGVLGLALMLMGVLALGGCDDQKVRMQRLAMVAQANRATGSSEIAKSYRKDGDTIDLLMAIAAEKMEKGEDATSLAGAIWMRRGCWARSCRRGMSSSSSGRAWAGSRSSQDCSRTRTGNWSTPAS